jgi:hypothetical protein
VDLLKVLCKLCPELNSSPRSQSLQVVFYFDEAHVLVTKDKTFSPNDDTFKLPLDHLKSALNAIVDLPFFAIFLSTQSNIEHMAPTSYLARSARYRARVPHLHSPITEVPFDVWNAQDEGTAIKPSCMVASQTEDIVYLSHYGRPLCVMTVHILLVSI